LVFAREVNQHLHVLDGAGQIFRDFRDVVSLYAFPTNRRPTRKSLVTEIIERRPFRGYPFIQSSS
jgi:hypothetical protein